MKRIANTRLIALIVALIMALGIVPFGLIAEDDGPEETTLEETTAEEDEEEPTDEDEPTDEEEPTDETTGEDEEPTDADEDPTEETEDEEAAEPDEDSEEPADESPVPAEDSAGRVLEYANITILESDLALLESPDNYVPDEEVTITYAGWENDLNFAIIVDRFEQRHPNIKVERFESNFVDEPELTRLAAAGELPDIISINNIGLSARNGWLLDLKDRFDSDPIAAEVSYDNIIDSLYIMDRLYALPTTIFLGGLVVNTDLLETNNIPIPSYDWTISELVEILHQATVRGESVGAMDLWFIYNWIPGSYENDKLGRMFLDEETKRFRMDRAWEDLISLYDELINSNISVWEHADRIGLPWELEEGDPDRKRQEDERAALQVDLYGSTEHGWDIGRAAMAPWETHGTGWLLNIPAYTGFNYDYYPYPKADDNDSDIIRPGLVTDLAGITTSSDDVDAAWELLKYITFEGVGYLDRIDSLYHYDRDEVIEKYGFDEEVAQNLPEDPSMLYQTQGPHMNQIPPNNTETVIQAFKDFHPIGSPDATPGLYYQLDFIEHGYLDQHRNHPGFNDGFGFIHDRIWGEVIDGDKAPADIAQEVQDGANRILDEWLADIEEAIQIVEGDQNP